MIRAPKQFRRRSGLSEYRGAYFWLCMAMMVGVATAQLAWPALEIAHEADHVTEQLARGEIPGPVSSGSGCPARGCGHGTGDVFSDFSEDRPFEPVRDDCGDCNYFASLHTGAVNIATGAHCPPALPRAGEVQFPAQTIVVAVAFHIGSPRSPPLTA